MPQQQKAKAKGRKIGRNKKHQATIYRAADRLRTNSEKRLRRHLRSNPTDIAALIFFENEYRKFDRANLVAKGRKVLRRIELAKKKRAAEEQRLALSQGSPKVLA